MGTYTDANLNETGDFIIAATVEGATFTIPNDPDHRGYRKLVAQGISIAPYAPPAPTEMDVKLEAARRIRAITGASTDEGAKLVQLKTLERVADIHDRQINGETIGADDIHYLALARAGRAAIELVREKSDEIEGMGPIPSDYADDKWWV